MLMIYLDVQFNIKDFYCLNITSHLSLKLLIPEDSRLPLTLFFSLS